MPFDLETVQARAVLDEKRLIAIDAKNKASEIKLSFVVGIPPGYQHQLMKRRADEEAQKPSPEEMARLERLSRRRVFNQSSRRVFKLLDANSSLSVEKEELVGIAAATEAEEFMYLLDFDGDGKIQLAEWLAFMVGVWEQDEKIADAFLLQFEYYLATKVEADTCFALFDLNSDGKLDWSEVQRFTQMPDGKTDGAGQFLNIVDVDRSGTIEKDEWVGFCLNILETHGPEVVLGFLDFLRTCFRQQTSS